MPPTQRIPLIRPAPPRLSTLLPQLEALEQGGIFSNNGPLVRRFEAASAAACFGGVGACVTTANATLGLMLALRQSAERAGPARTRALMPSFTFAATGHAAVWAGLTPMLCDIDPISWLPCAAAEERALRRHAGSIAAIVPYATFGAPLDMDRYAWLADRYDVDVVIDAAASLGTLDVDGTGFGTGSRFPVVFSLHATKTFATAEGGLIYCADKARAARLRSMAHYGFGAERSAETSGMNAKMTELMALLALEKLNGFADVVAHRAALGARYRRNMPALAMQPEIAGVQALQFMPLLLPRPLAGRRGPIMAALAEQGIGSGRYFSPHLAEQPYFRAMCGRTSLPVTRDVAARVLVLPLHDGMTVEEADIVSEALLDAIERQEVTHDPAPNRLPATPLGAQP